MKRVLGIETSCDETAIAVYDAEQGVLAHNIYSQIELHRQYGGVVPELASRDHQQKIVPLLLQTLVEANINIDDLDGVAYTAGPGLIGALLVGATFARSFAFARDLPCVGVHHMEGHLFAPMLEPQPPTTPFVALLVSGGHTMLVKVLEFGNYEILGESLDDAAGEAFDKTARLLGLNYPGGPEIAHLAEQGDATRFEFPRPMIKRPGFDFSFSGLKTAAMQAFMATEQDQQTKADIACAFQLAVVDTLSLKCQRALKATGLSQLVIAGGVSANQLLRQELHKMTKKLQAEVFYAKPEFCTDNAAMIAYVGYQRLVRGQREPLNFNVTARWPMSELV